MKINEVEALAGITKKNIRFYEEQGLLSPRRNAENGYRDYGEADVQILLRIRLLRKLGLPIEEIRQMLQGIHTVGDGMRRHMVSLEREKRNLEQSIDLCRELQTEDIPIAALDAQGLLERMERMERDGTAFRNRQVQDVRVQYTAPVAVTVIMVALMASLCALLLWAYTKDPADAPPLPVIICFMGILAAVGIGAVMALMQRIREIQKGEMDDARHY